MPICFAVNSVVDSTDYSTSDMSDKMSGRGELENL